ncbi:MAG: type II/IV secretion system ATPase subunit [Candidatus Anstonellales archaeon]
MPIESQYLTTYEISKKGVALTVTIYRTKDEYVPIYEVQFPDIGEGTKILLSTIKTELLSKMKLSITDLLDTKSYKKLEEKFAIAAAYLIKQKLPNVKDDDLRFMVVYIINDTLGMGDIEFLLQDEQLEEVVINSAEKPVMVYHKKFGWCKTNIFVKDEQTIYDYAAMIGRRVGKQISVLNPLMDAHLPSGDRVNATLSPISNDGNTITIRKFSKNPWTMPVLLNNKTITSEVAAMIWLMVQNELSIIVSGGTGSGKTSFLNAVAAFIPPNQRIITIEDTRELTLPSFLHVVPLVTREANIEGKGEITMLDLLVNSLRMRPDRIIVGEIRRKREAEILFEAMHTGHSVYGTFHADNAAEMVSRFTNPPIDIPKNVMNAIGGIVVQFRHRRLGIRRTLELAEIGEDYKEHVIYRWNYKADRLEKISEPKSILERLNLYAGLTEKEFYQDINEKKIILEWMLKKNIMDVNEVGKIISEYYMEPEKITNMAKNNEEFKF